MTETSTPTTQKQTGPRQTATIRPGPLHKRHDELIVETDVAGGDHDRTSLDEVLALLPSLPTWPELNHRRTRCRDGAAAILRWLQTYPGAGWQQRWVAAGADDDLGWVDALSDPTDPRCSRVRRDVVIQGVSCLLLCRVVLPHYRFLASFYSPTLYSGIRKAARPDLFALIESRADELGIFNFHRTYALNVISKLVLHTGRDVDQLTDGDLLAYRAWHLQNSGSCKSPDGLSFAWELLHGIADLGEHATLKDAVRYGQRPTAELVDAYGVQSYAVREVLIRYLDERRPAVDYGSFLGLVGKLVGLFWCDLERHNLGIDSLRLPNEVAEGWKQRIRVVTNKDGTTRPRKGSLDTLICVRSFYRDLQEWSLQDPAWSRWSYPNPIRKRDAYGQNKARRSTTAEMHQRIRERLPHLPTLIDTAERHRVEQAAFLATVKSRPIGGTVEHAGRSYRRVLPQSFTKLRSERGQDPPNRVQALDTGEVLDVDKLESDAFWAWAVIETLRHTGVRVEELLEATHLGLVSYKVPNTGELVPMLQIVPSKSNEERLLLVSPELASVLATIITRLRADNDGTVPLSARYDPHERVPGPMLPHLFQHRIGWKWVVPASTTVQKWLTQTLELSGLTDPAGKSLRYTPHDFRRMFATEAVTGGLPVHIVGRLLGHKNLNTTQAYVAVFDEELIRSYRSFLDSRRAVRPAVEYREPTDQEWRDFQQHFEMRKLELGTCGRPYGTPCRHEHACIRCPSLRVDPGARTRLVDIAANLRARIDEARANGWTGEVEGLRISLNAAAAKLASLDRMEQRSSKPNTGTAELGIPFIKNETRGQRR